GRGRQGHAADDRMQEADPDRAGRVSASAGEEHVMGSRRPGWIGITLALVVLAVLSVATLATAQETKPSGPLKGQWSLEVETPGGRMPMSIAFRGSDQGGVL